MEAFSLGIATAFALVAWGLKDPKFLVAAILLAIGTIAYGLVEKYVDKSAEEDGGEWDPDLQDWVWSDR